MSRSKSRPTGRSSFSAKWRSPDSIPTRKTAVAIAGGFGPRALHNPVTISHTIGGQVLRFDVPLTYQVRPGDTVRVKERWF